MKTFLVYNETGPVCSAVSFSEAKNMAAEYVNAVGADDAGALKIIELETGEYVYMRSKPIDFWSVCENAFMI